MNDGEKMLRLAETRIGERYVNLLVPKNNPNWHGPWDCAEFMSWLVYQISGRLYGCVDNAGNPATVEAYTGAWQNDARNMGKQIPWRDAAGMVGAVLLRYPPAPGSMGHIVVSDGQGGTVEAMGKKWGVCRGRIDGRAWDTGVLVPWFSYDTSVQVLNVGEPKLLYAIGRSGMKKFVVEEIQRKLKAAGFNPGPIDGDYGHNTAAAVAAFQTVRGLVVDGQVGRQTARSLGVTLS
jgi:N-acetylmuramoyl-L-alanine amidase